MCASYHASCECVTFSAIKRYSNTSTIHANIRNTQHRQMWKKLQFSAKPHAFNKEIPYSRCFDPLQFLMIIIYFCDSIRLRRHYFFYVRYSNNRRFFFFVFLLEKTVWNDAAFLTFLHVLCHSFFSNDRTITHNFSIKNNQRGKGGMKREEEKKHRKPNEEMLE